LTARRLAIGLWIVWAVLAWNVVYDHVIVVAAREYLAAAVLAADAGGPYAPMDRWMRPAAVRGLWIASSVAAIILAVGFAAITADSKSNRRERRTRRDHD
jgi:hypothetical protein